MGKKSAVNRLPKAERTHPTSKITVRPVEQMPSAMEDSLPHQPTKPERPISPLDDESLNKILYLAGILTTLRARSVNQQWRRVATEILNNVRFIELSRLFPNTPTSAMVHSTLNVVAHVESITIRNWPHAHVYPCIVDELVAVHLPRLKAVELLGVHVTPKTIATLIQKDSVRSFSLGEHDSVNKAVASAMTTAHARLFASNQTGTGTVTQYLLDRLVFKRARCLDGSDISLLSACCVAQELVAMSCPNIRDTHLSCQSPFATRIPKICEVYSLTNCRNLTNVLIRMSVASNDVSHLNLSQCTQLSSLTFEAVNAQSYQPGTILASDLRELNLSGCRELREVKVEPNGPVILLFPRLEKLILYGARRLNRTSLQNFFGLSRTIPVLPRLIRLDLNGTLIDKLILNEYPQLMWVDVSGCPYLLSIDVRECWRLQSFSVLGKRAPLETVSMILPVTCKVEGKRETWHWQTQGSHQAISYP